MDGDASIFLSLPQWLKEQFVNGFLDPINLLMT